MKPALIFSMALLASSIAFSFGLDDLKSTAEKAVSGSETPLAHKREPKAAPSEGSRGEQPSESEPTKSAKHTPLNLKLKSKYSPLTAAVIPSLVGKTVYVAVSKSISDGYLFSGEPVTLIEAKPFGHGFNYLTVKNAQGKTGEIQHIFLSATPLAFNFRSVDNAEKLIKDLSREGSEVALEIARVSEEHDFIHFDSSDDAYQVMNSMNEYAQFCQTMVHGLVYGFTTDEVNILKNPEYAWAAGSKDERLTKWLARGIPNEGLKNRLRNGEFAISTAMNAMSRGAEISNARLELEQKSWRRDTEHLDEAQRNKVEKMEIDKLQKTISEAKSKFKSQIAQARKEQSQL